jgi:RHS repeat-associated protein
LKWHCLKSRFFFTVTQTQVEAGICTPVFWYYHGDHLGSTSVITDRNGALVWHYEYFAFGKEKYTNAACSFSPSNRYTGQILDDDTGLYYYNARYYDPELGRFIQPDTIVPSAGDPQSLNRYSYVKNNPLLYIDPSGHSERYNAELDQNTPGPVGRDSNNNRKPPIRKETYTGSLIPSYEPPDGGTIVIIPVNPDPSSPVGAALRANHTPAPGNTTQSSQAAQNEASSPVGSDISTTGITNTGAVTTGNGPRSPMGSTAPEDPRAHWQVTLAGATLTIGGPLLFFGAPVAAGGGTMVGFTDEGQIFVQFQAAGMVAQGGYAGVGWPIGLSRTSSSVPGRSVNISTHFETQVAIGGSGGGVADISRSGLGATASIRPGAGIGVLVGAGAAINTTLATPRISWQPVEQPLRLNTDFLYAQ